MLPCLHTDSLRCKWCTYSESDDIPDELANFGFSLDESGATVNCIANAGSVSTQTCPTPGQGQKAVCVYSKGIPKVGLKVGSEFKERCCFT